MDLLGKVVTQAQGVAHSPGRRAAFLTVALAAISMSAPPTSLGVGVALFQLALWSVLAFSGATVAKQSAVPKAVSTLLQVAVFIVWAGVLTLEVLPHVT